MSGIPITRVRFDEAEGRAKIERFMSRDRYNGTLLPHGIEPALVSAFIREHLTSESPPEIYFRALELMRFYERQDVLPHLHYLVSGERHGGEMDALLRAVCVLEAVGDFGSQAEITNAVAYLNQIISTYPSVIPAFRTLGETIVALATRDSFQVLSQRLSDLVARAAQLQNQGSDAMREYQQFLSLQRNDLPQVEFVLDARRRLLTIPQPQRRRQLVAVYLKQAPFSSIQMEVWAARLLRLEAMQDNPEPVYSEFANAIDAADRDRSNSQLRDFVIERAVQAIIYLQGMLSPKHADLYQEVAHSTPNFLWDYP